MAQDYDDRVESALSQMSDALRRMAHLGSANPLAQRNGVEAVYGQAYQRLVRIGARTQIKRKYRVR